jgi:hypothetical protein
VAERLVAAEAGFMKHTASALASTSAMTRINVSLSTVVHFRLCTKNYIPLHCIEGLIMIKLHRDFISIARSGAQSTRASIKEGLLLVALSEVLLPCPVSATMEVPPASPSPTRTAAAP